MSRPAPIDPLKLPKWSITRFLFAPNTFLMVSFNLKGYSDYRKVRRSSNTEKMIKRIRSAKYDILKEYRATSKHWRKEKAYLNKLKEYL